MPQTVFADPVSGFILKNKYYRRQTRADRMAGKWAEGPTNFARAEEALWKAVIMQAMIDATVSARHPEQMYHKLNALEWLTENSPDFLDVCEHADMDPNYVRVHIKKALANPGAWRIESGASARYQERKVTRAQKRLRRIQQINAPQPGCVIYYLSHPWRLYE